MFQTGYILNRRSDLTWFIGLPFAAVLFALASQQWLPAVVMSSVALWITIPHHFATWIRTYGFSEDWKRWTDRLIIGPLVIFGFTFLGAMSFPLTLYLVSTLWDHQHSIMQQHGFGRIYDFKAGTGTRKTARFDLGLHWILFGNMLVTSPLFSSLWISELYRWEIHISLASVQMIHTIGWTLTGTYVVIYLLHLGSSLRQGKSLNPLKYAFIGASYFLWYYSAWHTASVLVWGIAHRLMHGIQYIVIVYWYLRRKVDQQSEVDQQGEVQAGAAPKKFNLVRFVVRSGNVKFFLLIFLIYAALYQLAILQPLEVFGFGVVRWSEIYRPIPELGVAGLNPTLGYHLYTELMITAFALTHYYFDSFIWKVRDSQVQGGL
ncbi:MAG: hypothetical protein OSB47_12890 [Pirellulaceae bacterium]|nr:hypothetical protein [Pirellulaceae bacterium]